GGPGGGPEARAAAAHALRHRPGRHGVDARAVRRRARGREGVRPRQQRREVVRRRDGVRGGGGRPVETARAARPGVRLRRGDARDILAIHGIAMPRQNALLGQATLVATMVAGGVRPNVLPGECVIELDGRPTPEYDNDTMIEMLKGAVKGTVDVKSRRFEPVA